MITVDMIEAKKVIFLKPIFEEDFVETGMTAWLTGVEWDKTADCYNLFFDFSDFEDINDKYFRRSYYSNRFTRMIDPEGIHTLYTAKESNDYQAKYSVYFSPVIDGKCVENEDPKAFAESIKEYLKEVE